MGETYGQNSTAIWSCKNFNTQGMSIVYYIKWGLPSLPTSLTLNLLLYLICVTDTTKMTKNLVLRPMLGPQSNNNSAVTGPSVSPAAPSKLSLNFMPQFPRCDQVYLAWVDPTTWYGRISYSLRRAHIRITLLNQPTWCFGKAEHSESIKFPLLAESGQCTARSRQKADAGHTATMLSSLGFGFPSNENISSNETGTNE